MSETHVVTAIQWQVAAGHAQEVMVLWQLLSGIESNQVPASRIESFQQNRNDVAVFQIQIGFKADVRTVFLRCDMERGVTVAL